MGEIKAARGAVIARSSNRPVFVNAPPLSESFAFSVAHCLLNVFSPVRCHESKQTQRVLTRVLSQQLIKLQFLNINTEYSQEECMGEEPVCNEDRHLKLPD